MKEVLIYVRKEKPSFKREDRTQTHKIAPENLNENYSFFLMSLSEIVNSDVNITNVYATYLKTAKHSLKVLFLICNCGN